MVEPTGGSSDVAGDDDEEDADFQIEFGPPDEEAGLGAGPH
jgi:hypothetical protein